MNGETQTKPPHPVRLTVSIHLDWNPDDFSPEAAQAIYALAEDLADVQKRLNAEPQP